HACSPDALSVACLHSYDHHRHLHPFPTRRSSDLTQMGVALALRPFGQVGVVTLASGDQRSQQTNMLTLVITQQLCGDLLGGLRRSEEHTSELQSRFDLVCRLLLETRNERVL